MLIRKKLSSIFSPLSLWVGFGGMAALLINYFGEPEAFAETWIIITSVISSLLLFLVPRFPRIVSLAYLVVYISMMMRPEIGAPGLILLAPLFAGVLAYRGYLKLGILGAFLIAYVGTIDVDEGIYIPAFLDFFISGIVVALPVGIGYTFHRARGQREQLMHQWDTDVKTRQETVGRTLHDSVASSLTSLIMRLEALSIREDLTERTKKELVDLVEQARVSMKEVRGLLHALSSDDSAPGKKPAAGLTQQLTSSVRRLKDHGFTVKTSGHLPLIDLNADQLIVLREVFGELATNIVKYAERNSTVSIDVSDVREGAHMSITNIVSQAPRKDVFSSGMGLPALAQLMESIGGSFSTTSNSTRWTTELILPCD